MTEIYILIHSPNMWCWKYNNNQNSQKTKQKPCPSWSLLLREGKTINNSYKMSIDKQYKEK
jgi:hypothetical protein